MIKQSFRGGSQNQASTQSKPSLEDDNTSINSDISANMDRKVFHGAISTLKVLEDKNIKDKNKSSLFKNYKRTKTNTNSIIDNGKTKEKETIDNNNNTNQSQINKNLNIKNRKIPSPYSFRVDASQIFDSMAMIDAEKSKKLIEKDKIKKEPLEENLIVAKQIKNMMLGSENEDEKNNENNMFYNLNNKLSISKEKLQAPTSSQFTCTLAKIDKGIAHLVSEDDIIFSLPLIFLPKNIQPGNSYQMNINESMKVQYKLNSLQKIHRNYLESKNKIK